MFLRVIKEQWDESGNPIRDTSRPHLPQLVNGGQVRVLDPKTRQPRTYLPGEVFELPDAQAHDLLRNAPNTVEPEARHQARMARIRQKDEAREAERESLDARQRELETQVAQSQKLRAMAEERERTLAAENLRVAQQAQGKDAQIAELRALLDEQRKQHEEQLARLEARVAAAALSAPSPSPAPAEPGPIPAPAEPTPADKPEAPERSRKKPNG